MSNIRLGQIKTDKGWDKRASMDKPRWMDLPSWGRTRGSPFLTQLSTECLDEILSHPDLHLRDHLSLAATCRTLRAAYYTKPSKSDPSQPLHSNLWAGLLAIRPIPEMTQYKYLDATSAQVEAINKIWTNRTKNPKKMKVIEQVNDGYSTGMKRAFHADQDSVIRSKEWNEAILIVHMIRISKTDAKKHYKLSEKELENYLSCFLKKNPYAPKTGALSSMYFEVAVESLALRLHGGYLGHKALLAKRAAITAKAKRTRIANGTDKTAKPKPNAGMGPPFYNNSYY